MKKLILLLGVLLSSCLGTKYYTQYKIETPKGNFYVDQYKVERDTIYLVEFTPGNKVRRTGVFPLSQVKIHP